MHTLLYFFQVLSIAQFITTSQSLLEALTPCVLTASDGDVVQAYCEETITPCILTASNGAIVQAYCEPSLVTQLFASITGISAPRNTNGTTSNFQILAASSNTVCYRILISGKTSILNIYRYFIMETPTRPRVRRSHSQRMQYHSLLPAYLSHLTVLPPRL